MAEDENDDIASRQQVFDTAELLEHILIQLPVKDLLLDQRVCKVWKNCIDNSVKLQKGLFMRPAGEMKVEEYEADRDSGLFLFPPIPSKTRYCITTKKCFINPLFIGRLGFERTAQFIIGELDEADIPRSLQHPQASWRSMVATQPPLPALKLECLVPEGIIAPDDDELVSAFIEDAKQSEELKRIMFLAELQMILVYRASHRVSAQDIQALENKSSATDQGKGAMLTLDFKKATKLSPNVGTDNVTLQISRAGILTRQLPKA